MAKLQETKTPLVMNLQLFADTQEQQGESTQQQTGQQEDSRARALEILAQSQNGDSSQNAAPLQGQLPEGTPQGQQPNQASAGNNRYNRLPIMLML